MRGRCVLVTEVAHFVSFATASAFADAGAVVGVVERDEPAVSAAADKITREGGTCLAYVADPSSASQARQCLATFIADVGRLDVLYNGPDPASCLPSQYQTTSGKTHRRLHSHRQLVRTIAAALPVMLQRASGSLINVTVVLSPSQWGRQTTWMTTHPTLRLTSALAEEYSTRGITCNAIVLGVTAPFESRQSVTVAPHLTTLSDSDPGSPAIGDAEEAAAAAALFLGSAGGGLDDRCITDR